MPAVAGLRDQQGDHVALEEAEQGAVVSGCVREDGLDPSSAVPLQARRHGAGPGQRAGLRWWTDTHSFVIMHRSALLQSLQSPTRCTTARFE